jgi:hypothetical protein
VGDHVDEDTMASTPLSTLRMASTYKYCNVTKQTLTRYERTWCSHHLIFSKLLNLPHLFLEKRIKMLLRNAHIQTLRRHTSGVRGSWNTQGRPCSIMHY